MERIGVILVIKPAMAAGVVDGDNPMSRGMNRGGCYANECQGADTFECECGRKACKRHWNKAKKKCSRCACKRST